MGSSCLTRDQTCAPLYWECGVSITGLSGTSLLLAAIISNTSSASFFDSFSSGNSVYFRPFKIVPVLGCSGFSLVFHFLSLLSVWEVYSGIIFKLNDSFLSHAEYTDRPIKGILSFPLQCIWSLIFLFLSWRFHLST